MESANLQHQLQELFVGYSSLVSAPRTAPITTHECNPNIILEGNSYNNPCLVDQSLQCSSRENENENVWFNFSSTYQRQQPPNEQQLSTLYSSVQSPASYGGFQGIPAGSNTNYYTNDVYSNNSNNNNNNSNTSTLDLLSSSSFSSSMGYNLQAAHHHHHHHLDFLSSTPNYSSGFNKNRALFGYAHQNHHHVQDSINNNNSPSNSSNKTSSTSVGRAKRPVTSLSEPKKSNNPESKKSCSTSRSTCPPLKVRKEKLGDRISALQRLVAPFGKTDTSSVLTEAIGYIQFLHDQVETLSMPYLGSSQSKPYQKQQPGPIQEDGTKPRQDLRSRGLCLMPVSCASFIHGFD
ncbi:transcription factor bHLH133-like [Benincasa hispida]|uniref:transcription factor bHLH133-like n=1 Tax=Benincasa hispida TaxID=102211 RepID=UPI0019018A57|nr:transcription factor bHLH133-like [Benincasa hispida]